MLSGIDYLRRMEITTDEVRQLAKDHGFRLVKEDRIQDFHARVHLSSLYRQMHGEDAARLHEAHARKQVYYHLREAAVGVDTVELRKDETPESYDQYDRKGWNITGTLVIIRPAIPGFE